MVGQFLSQVDFNTVIIAIGAIFIAFNQYKSSKFQDYKDALAGKDLKIAELEGTIRTNKAKADSDIAKLEAKSKSDVAALTAEINHLKESNIVLQNTVTGKENLESIQRTLAPVPAFFAAGGALETFIANDKMILETLESIKGQLTGKENEQK